MSTIIYTRSTAKQKLVERQQLACRSLLQLHGIDDRSGALGPQYRTELATGGTPVLFEGLATHGWIHQGDLLVVASLDVLADTPSALLSILGTAWGKGVKVLVADLGGEPELRSLRPLVEAFLPVEAKIAALEAEAVARERAHKEEMDDLAANLEERITDLLHQRGIGLTTGLLTTDGAKVARPDEGRELRDLRTSMSLTGEQAGALVKPEPLSKAQWSKCETQGSAAAHFNVAMAFLRAEKVRRDRAAKAKAELEAQRAAFGSVPTVSGEEAAAAAIADQFGPIGS